ncbi:MAG: undecaprenyl-diphosphatase UppP [bacterium]
MGFIESAILGIVQGLTEFLPVSSSGHLVFMQNVLGVGEIEILFDVFLHVGTLLAVFVFFRKDIAGIFSNVKNIRSFRTNVQARTLLFIIIASVPTAIIGLAFKDYFEKVFNNLLIVACFLFVTGVFLFIAERVSVPSDKQKSMLGMNISDALIIGCMQGFAIAPGISRSGATITAGIFRGINRELAARFSFLLSIPAILGAFLMELKDCAQMLGSVSILSIVTGTLLAFLSGYYALRVLFSVIRKRRLGIFAYYCWAVGLVIVVRALLLKT